MKMSAAHLGGLLQQGEAQPDGLAALRLAAPAVREHPLQRGRVHAPAVVAHAQDQPVMFAALQDADLHLLGVGGERIHGNVQDVL